VYTWTFDEMVAKDKAIEL